MLWPRVSFIFLKWAGSNIISDDYTIVPVRTLHFGMQQFVKHQSVINAGQKIYPCLTLQEVVRLFQLGFKLLDGTDITD